jgi:uncharacterized protein
VGGTAAVMTSDDIARYLKEHPEFFEEHAEFLASMYIPHPHGGRAIPLAERQVLTLREKSRLLEGKLRELVQFGEENDSISERVHRVTLALLAAGQLPELLDALYQTLHAEFGVSATAVRLWAPFRADARSELATVSEEARVFTESLSEPYFSSQPMFDTLSWFDAACGELASFAYLPLRAERLLGLLVLGSEDAHRFAPDKGTLYLTRLGETVSMALKRYAAA